MVVTTDFPVVLNGALVVADGVISADDHTASPRGKSENLFTEKLRVLRRGVTASPQPAEGVRRICPWNR